MGYEIARGFAQSDARGVAMIDINDELGAKVHKELEAEFPSVQLKYYHLNISDYEEVKLYKQFRLEMNESWNLNTYRSTSGTKSVCSNSRGFWGDQCSSQLCRHSRLYGSC
jgi:hypothetical protein